MAKFRMERRRPSINPIELYWEIGAGYVRSAAAEMRDQSRTGMGLLAPVPFIVGSAIQVKVDNRVHPVTVRRCFKANSQYFVGVQFHTDSD